MSNRKPATAAKRVHTSKKVTQRAERAAQAVVRSSIARRAPAADSTKSPPEPQRDADQEARLVDRPAMVLQDDTKQTMTATEPKREPVFSSAMASAGAYQAKLLEMAQANMQFALEFAQRLAAIRSPIELLSVIQELTNQRIAMFRKYSNEMVAISLKR